jgi:membrane protein YdbS with pleckstrin-like domain
MRWNKRASYYGNVLFMERVLRYAWVVLPVVLGAIWWKFGFFVAFCVSVAFVILCVAIVVSILLIPD